MYLIRPSLLMRKLYSSAIWRINSKPSVKQKSKIYLTFDDGPVPIITPWVLSLLKEYKAKATFFCVGTNVEKYPEVFHQLISEGHSIGNHTYTHVNGWKTTTKEYLENVEKFEKELESATSGLNYARKTVTNKPLFRPPYGKMKLSQFYRLRSHYSIIMWDVLSGDFDQSISEEKCLRNVITKTRDGSIVVFHDSVKAEKNLFFVLPQFLEHFSKKGAEFSLLPSL